jgi:hypothetical protein
VRYELKTATWVGVVVAAVALGLSDAGYDVAARLLLIGLLAGAVAVGNGVSSSRYQRLSVFTKKKRNAATWRRTVNGRSFRCCSRYAWYDRKCL